MTMSYCAFFISSFPFTLDPGENLFLTALIICENQKKFSTLSAVFPTRYTVTNHMGNSPISQSVGTLAWLAFDVHFTSSKDLIGPADEAVNAV